MTDTNSKQKNNRNRNNQNVVKQVAIPSGRAPTTRYVAKRQISLTNQQVAKQLKHMDYFGLNYSTLIGAFIKASQSESVTLFDEYVSKLIFTTRELVKHETQKMEEVLKQYSDQGWVFEMDGKPQDVVVNIYRNCLNDFTDLLLDIDKLVTQLNYLEKTPQINTPDLFVKVSDWVKVPNQLSRKIVGLTKRLNDKFQFDARNKGQKYDKVNFGKINALLATYEKEQIQVLAVQSAPQKKVQAPVKKAQSTKGTVTAIDKANQPKQEKAIDVKVESTVEAEEENQSAVTTQNIRQWP